MSPLAALSMCALIDQRKNSISQIIKNNTEGKLDVNQINRNLNEHFHKYPNKLKNKETWRNIWKNKNTYKQRISLMVVKEPILVWVAIH